MNKTEVIQVLEVVKYYDVDEVTKIKAIDVAIAALQKEWISVEDSLPEVGSWVLCYLRGHAYGGRIQVCKFCAADKYVDHPYFDHFRNGFPTVTHWMHLPEPSTEKSKKEGD